MIANAKAVLRALCYNRILNQQPPETPLNAQRIFTNKVLKRRTLSPIVGPPAEEACHIGQCGTENRLYFKAFHLFFFPKRSRRSVGPAVLPASRFRAGFCCFGAQA